MSLQDTPRTLEDNNAADLGLCLPAEELAVALYMSGMPDRRPKGDTWTLAQLAAWVDDGIEAIGSISGVWLTAYWSQRHSEAGNWPDYRHFWGNPHREKTARQAAAQITASDTYDYQPKLAQVVIASCDAGHEWTIDIDARDVRFAAQRGVILR